MKKLTILFFAVMMMFTGLACSKGDSKKGSISTRGRNGRSGGTGRNSLDNNSNYRNGQAGRISTDQSHLDAFLSAQDDPTQIVGSITGSGAGVYFSGQADVSGNYINNAELRLEIVDSWYLNKDVNETLRINTLRFLRGTIEGDTGTSGGDNRITMEFGDDLQTVRFEGQIRGDSFEGNVMFENSVHFNGEEPYTGQLGTFSIGMCQFFRCN